MTLVAAMISSDISTETYQLFLSTFEIKIEAGILEDFPSSSGEIIFRSSMTEAALNIRQIMESERACNTSRSITLIVS